MENPVYRDEFIREQARIAARASTASTQKKARPWLAWLLMLPLIGYSVYVVAGITGINLGIFLQPDFIAAVLILSAVFVWSLWQR